jgi:hypothetical protein
MAIPSSWSSSFTAIPFHHGSKKKGAGRVLLQPILGLSLNILITPVD